MPLLYGKRTKAFLRLQEEVLRSTADRSILLWQPHSPGQIHILFAPDNASFSHLSEIDFRENRFEWRAVRNGGDRDNILTNRGLRTTLACADRVKNDYVMPSLHLWKHVPSRNMMLLRQVNRTGSQHGTSTIPAFEVIRAVEPHALRIELTRPDATWSLREMVLLREPQGAASHLDLNDGLEINSVNHEPVQWQNAEVRHYQPIRDLHIKDRKPNSEHKLQLGPHKTPQDVSTQWVSVGNVTKAFSSLPGTEDQKFSVLFFGRSTVSICQERVLSYLGHLFCASGIPNSIVHCKHLYPGPSFYALFVELVEIEHEFYGS
ncbi:hypothetical protein BST61_g2352 [Cercospora zeina]